MFLPQRTYFTPDCPFSPLAPRGPWAPVLPTAPWFPLGPAGPGNGLLVPGFPGSPAIKRFRSISFLEDRPIAFKTLFSYCWFVVVVLVNLYFNDSINKRSCFKLGLIDFIRTARAKSKKDCKHNPSVTNNQSDTIVNSWIWRWKWPLMPWV